MLTVEKIKALFEALNKELKKRDVIGEVGICGGAVMCLVFNAREATRDVDAIFWPTQVIREASSRVAEELGVPDDWLNDAAKVFFTVDPPRREVLHYSHLRIWAPTADYLLAMKCISARFDTHDRDDVIFLVRYLDLREPDEVFTLIERYYPHQQIPAETKFFVEEILQTVL